MFNRVDVKKGWMNEWYNLIVIQCDVKNFVSMQYVQPLSPLLKLISDVDSMCERHER